MKAIIKLGLHNICLSVSLPDTYGVKPVDVLSPVLFIFYLEYAAGNVRANLEGLKLNDTHQLLVSADDDSLLADNLWHKQREKEINI